MTGRWDTIREKYLPTIVVAISVIALWELLVRLFNIQQFLLPKPSAIVSSLFSEWAVIQPRILFTLRSAVGGFLLANGGDGLEGGTAVIQRVIGDI